MTWDEFRHLDRAKVKGFTLNFSTVPGTVDYYFKKGVVLKIKPWGKMGFSAFYPCEQLKEPIYYGESEA